VNELMNLLENAADRLLTAIVPHAKAAAWSCPPGCFRRTCGCYADSSGAYWYDWCAEDRDGVTPCTANHQKQCLKTVWTC
jgi:hypothetical protein